ncbi:MAG: 5-formyltetrahydrofolate cyclo-ligase [Boseongicola sp. SB0664_bin_43]|uniref:5-formyltetrahydrofolate cyclo-ligase n=1 Tax=Boseongicola sp. SB0664_bin_43 TaxID=2604844 RepID=A0A6B0Y0I8_9RHOB|nr:5-formyltetrahydrofolate cyclo-ligase [Boseongicola sp. SB0664_bin_43]MYK31158.1 5-formyltetrahydrofolate cyclo-ligase [Boseongicola sp. SB0670_bin_30]
MRKAASRRRAMSDPGAKEAACRHLVAAVRNAKGYAVSGYWPIRTEIDPRPAMFALAASNELCLPVVQGVDQVLMFLRWTPGAELVEGAFGTAVPRARVEVVPSILIVPLLAFDGKGGRLGYGGGHYDRTLEALRSRDKVTAIGFAYDIQECRKVPREPTDQPLDLVVTESGARRLA